MLQLVAREQRPWSVRRSNSALGLMMLSVADDLGNCLGPA
jgi:hypothetical protein